MCSAVHMLIWVSGWGVVIVAKGRVAIRQGSGVDLTMRGGSIDGVVGEE